MIHDPIVPVTCDFCGHEEGLEIAALACNSYDLRDLASDLKHSGWITEGDLNFCREECKEDYWQ